MKSRRARRLALAGGIGAAGVGATILGITALGTAAAASHPTLVVYSAQGYDKAMVAAFEHQYPSIPVTLNDNSTGPLLTQVEAERNNPQWGLLWVDGATAFAGLDTQGLLARHTAPPKSGFNALGKSVYPANGSFTPTGVTLVPGVAYNASKISAAKLKTLNDILNYAKAHPGKVGMNDPTQSGPTFPLIAGVMNYLGHGSVSVGIRLGEQYFLNLKKYGLVSNGTNGSTLPKLDNGTYDIAMVQSSAAIGDTRAGGDPTAPAPSTNRVTYVGPATLLPSAIGIDKKASPAVQAEAKLFIKFALSKLGQRIMQYSTQGDPYGDGLYYPVVKGVSPKKGLPSLASVATQAINPYKWGPLQASINRWWVQHILN